MRKQDLKNGMIVRDSNNFMLIVIDNGLIGTGVYGQLNDFDDDLIDTRFGTEIIEVYIMKKGAESSLEDIFDLTQNRLKLIWKRDCRAC